ncbi:hypothetical protein E4U17_003104 [Claviceps sp. LM77 group G4]|nr:hypothetical protein E4U17_003104 [Claviceps sp. LM77 group G4]KAG6074797.1 hypothetical protein E4U33_002308 [Claviceps sp. LM78 group G4]KAG6076420.1 hypothetical protein E4U16_002780 [Claviceps sp. LM84 group G4]
MAGHTTSKKRLPTAQEAMFFFAIVKHTRNKADIDWNAVALEQSFKNADVAKVRFGQVKRKLGIKCDAGPTVTTPPPSCRAYTKTMRSVAGTPTTKMTRSGSGASTPTKVVKALLRAGSKRKVQGKAVEEDGGEDVDLEEERREDGDADMVEGVKGEQEGVDERVDEKDAVMHEEVDGLLEEETGDLFWKT